LTAAVGRRLLAEFTGTGLPGPAGQDIGAVRRIRDQIRTRVEALAAELFTGPGRDAP
jgi:hypothetical protein